MCRAHSFDVRVEQLLRGGQGFGDDVVLTDRTHGAADDRNEFDGLPAGDRPFDGPVHGVAADLGILHADDDRVVHGSVPSLGVSVTPRYASGAVRAPVGTVKTLA